MFANLKKYARDSCGEKETGPLTFWEIVLHLLGEGCGGEERVEQQHFDTFIPQVWQEVSAPVGRHSDESP